MCHNVTPLSSDGSVESDDRDNEQAAASGTLIVRIREQEQQCFHELDPVRTDGSPGRKCSHGHEDSGGLPESRSR